MAAILGIVGHEVVVSEEIIGSVIGRDNALLDVFFGNIHIHTFYQSNKYKVMLGLSLLFYGIVNVGYDAALMCRNHIRCIKDVSADFGFCKICKLDRMSVST